MSTDKLKTKNFNTTDLDTERAFTHHIYHRDMFAHYFRWTHILKKARVGEVICDFGCGNGPLCEVLYRNRFKQAKYIGIDIRDKFDEKLADLDWVEFYQDNLVDPTGVIDYESINADKVVSFEVMEHVGKQNGATFLQNFKKCGKDDAEYYLSTPNYDEQVGAAGNHTYDSGDGRGEAVQEWEHSELEQAIKEAGFIIVKKYGTFASQKDYKPHMKPWQKKMFDFLREYYDVNLLSNLMAPMFPEQSRNTLWVLKQQPEDSLFNQN